MSLDGLRVAISGAGRDTGRLLAEAFAGRGAQVFLSARNLAAAEQVAGVIRRRGVGRADGFGCDLGEAASVRAFAAAVARRADHLDVLINNGAGYLDGADLAAGADEAIEAVMAAGADEAIEAVMAAAGTGTVLLTRHLLPLLRRSPRPDIVNMISACGQVGHRRSGAHPAFYAAKHAQAGFAEILSYRLRPEGIRVISLFPPDFVQDGPRQADRDLTARSVVDCVLFAVGQPRDCFISQFHFEQVRGPHPE